MEGGGGEGGSKQNCIAKLWKCSLKIQLLALMVGLLVE